MALVSIIIPSYNHAEYLQQRLQSISNQTYKNLEIIILDDASTDYSKKIIQQFIERDRSSFAIYNKINSGSPFKQWKKGVELASGKYIWIAESDDLAAPHFLEKLVQQLELKPSVMLAVSQIRMMTKDGLLGGKPMEWLSEFNSQRWNSDYTNNGLEEIKYFLSKKNTILNASSVVMRNFNGLSELVDSTMRFCADWLLWIRLLEKGDIAYVAEPLAFWRVGSGNARNQRDYQLELTEGPKIIAEAGRILKWSFEELTEAQRKFKNRYQ